MVRLARSGIAHRAGHRKRRGRSHGRLHVGDRRVVAVDSPVRHDFDFTPSMSIFVCCEHDEEVRLLFSQIASDGEVKMPLGEYPFSSCFGWTTDRYGVSWQIGTADRDLTRS